MRTRSEEKGSLDDLLRNFFSSSTVGLAIIDDKLRYQAINPSLASMNGAPPEYHLNKTLREVLGGVADRLEPAFRRILSSGESIFNLQLEGSFPTRRAAGRWLDHLFPIRGAGGTVSHVGAIVIELPMTNGLGMKLHEAPPILITWKEIAHYVGTCVRTVQRWERVNQFPIRRLERAKGSPVFAATGEIRNWISDRTGS